MAYIKTTLTATKGEGVDRWGKPKEPKPYYSADVAEFTAALKAIVGFEVGTVYINKGEVMIFKPLPPKVAKPVGSKGAAPLADPYQYQTNASGIKYRWKPGMKAWGRVEEEAPPPLPEEEKMAESPPPLPGEAMTEAQIRAKLKQIAKAKKAG